MPVYENHNFSSKYLKIISNRIVSPEEDTSGMSSDDAISIEENESSEVMQIPQEDLYERCVDVFVRSRIVHIAFNDMQGLTLTTDYGEVAFYSGVTVDTYKEFEREFMDR